MSAELPPELTNRVDRVFSQVDRGLVTVDELENELWDTFHRFADHEFERAHPDWAKDALFNQLAWETGFEAKERSQAELGAKYALALADTDERARGLIACVFQSPQWRQALEPVQAQLVAAAAAGLDAVEAVAATGWLAAWRGALPPDTRRAVRDAPLGSAASMIDLLESDREGDAARVAQIVEASGRCGCVSPAVQLLRLRKAEGREVDAATIADLFDPADLATRGEFGGITHMAVELLADGAVAKALLWSSAVDDSELFHAPAERPTIYSGWEPYQAYESDRRQRVHGPGWCVPLCNCGDARLLGALAVLDWLAGNEQRARVRAVACDSGADPNGWSASGVDLLAEWVLSRQLAPTRRAEALQDMIKTGGRSHVDLGLLGVQVHTELADLSEVVDGHDAAAHHRARADWFRARPDMHLHFEPFQFHALLNCLPLAI